MISTVRWVAMFRDYQSREELGIVLPLLFVCVVFQVEMDVFVAAGAEQIDVFGIGRVWRKNARFLTKRFTF